MSIQKIAIESREQWLALRELDVTASVAAALYGVHPYHSVYSLWALKKRLITEDPEETPAMRRGRHLEPVATAVLLEQHPDWRIEEPKVYLRDPEGRIGATPDRYVYIPEKPGFGVLQIKSVEESIFKRKWITEDGAIEPPLWIGVQAEVERHLSGANFAMVGVVRAGFGLDCSAITIPPVPGLMKRTYSLVADFWRLVASDTRPDPDYEKDGKLLEALWTGGGSEAVLDLSTDNHLVDLADEKARLAEQKREIDDRQKQIKAEFLHKLGSASAGKIADGRIITAKKVDRAGYTVQASSYIDVRVKQPRGNGASE